MAELPKHGLCRFFYVAVMQFGGFTLRLSEIRHLLACSRDSLHCCNILYSMMIDCICLSDNKFLFYSVTV